MSSPSPGSNRSEFTRGLALALVPIIVVLCANIPGRRVFAVREGSFGRPAWQFFVGGLFGDLVTDLPVLAAVMLLGSAVVMLASRRGRPRLARLGVVTTSTLLFLLTVVFWLFSVGGTEHKLQRGLYPTWLETRMALSDATFVLGSLPLLVLTRYRWVSLGALIIVLATLVWVGLRSWRRPVLGWRTIAGLAVGIFAAVAVSAPPLFAAPAAFPSVDHRRELYPPLVTLAKGLMSQPKTQIFRGLRAVLSNATFPDDVKREGAHAIGLSGDQGAATIAAEKGAQCDRHPWRRDLGDKSGRERASAGAVLTSLEDLSEALFSGKDAPVVVWHVAVESFRGDDIAGLNPDAPPEIAPFITSMANSSGAQRGHDVVFTHAHQSGVRTSQNVSAMMCGIGGMPFNMALSRDVGYLPVRCLPDVLGDAGYATHVYYASELSFDNMNEFFRYHGVATTQQNDLPSSLPKAVWGCTSDLPLYEEAMKRSAAAGGPQYNFVLTLAGHTPFVVPEDLPSDVRARVDAAIAKASIAPSEDDRNRLYTIAYGDWSLEQFFRRVDESPAAARSIIVVLGDHSTGDPFLWKSGSTTTARSRIPLVVHFPEALLSSAADGARARQGITALQEKSATTPVSSADVPTMLLALLGSTKELRTLDPAWRWHTLGAVAASGEFRATGQPDARIWGVDAASDIFVVDGSGAHGIGEQNESFTEPGQLTNLGPVVRGVAAVFSSFLAGYASKCPGAENIRKNAPRLE